MIAVGGSWNGHNIPDMPGRSFEMMERAFNGRVAWAPGKMPATVKVKKEIYYKEEWRTPGDAVFEFARWEGISLNECVRVILETYARAQGMSAELARYQAQERERFYGGDQ